MKKEIVIEYLANEHPAKAHGYNFNVALYLDNVCCGVGKFAKTRKEAEELQKELLQA